MDPCNGFDLNAQSKLTSPLKMKSQDRRVSGLSARGLNWTDRCADEGLVLALEQESGLDSVTARLLAGRGIAPGQALAFLDPKLRDYLPDPFSLQDMARACQEILRAMSLGKKITIFADYDVDGGTSAAQLIRWARAMGHEFGLYVPDRIEEGYGPSEGAFEHLKNAGTELVITVDCGAAAHSALSRAAEIDLPVIVIDHHLMEGGLPPALAIVNPNRPDDTSGLGNLAAAGVTFMVLVALNREAKRSGLDNMPNLLDYIGFTALGTICDVVSLTGLNRAIVSQGLRVLSRRAHPGIEALADVAGASGDFTTYHAGFVLGPRINAGGRIGRADMGAELLSTENAQLAYAHAAELQRVNEDRKVLQGQILEEALSDALARKDEAIVIVERDGWHAGVIGIIAGRLKDRFDKPSIVIGIDEAGMGKGSGRSIKGVNLGAAIVRAKEAGLLISGGGHEMAGGLSIARDKIEAFRDFMNAELSEDVEEARKSLSLQVDAWLTPQAANEALCATINTVGPFGAGNPQPVFAFANMRVAYAKRVRGGHVRFSFESSGGERISGICFRADETGLSDWLLGSETVLLDIAGRLKQDSWKGRTRVDFQLTDVRRADERHFRD